jgi:hypothetical protein
MRYIKTYEKFENLQVGDYVKIEPSLWSDAPELESFFIYEV